ncbi:apses-domain-containing protein [Auricularia subglabra TFB-10046 SS5]|nr:apses-domain-containing protein [Auricularia subglabra TFB-10046 SS5]
MGPMAGMPRQMAPIKIYNAVYSSVQVYECMVRGIAVMRRRPDSFVNATQILKVAGIEKGRRTKILEKDILPGKHDIVQGGYGKYQGTWIPLERGRELATQYGVGPLLGPLFDFVPHAIPAFQPGMPPGFQIPPGMMHPQQRFAGGPPPPHMGYYGPGMPFPGYPPPPHMAQGMMPPGAPMGLIKQGRPPSAMFGHPPPPGGPQGARPAGTPAPPITFDPHSRSAREAVAAASSLKRPRGSMDDTADKSRPPTPAGGALQTDKETPDQPAAKRARTQAPAAPPARPASTVNGTASPRPSASTEDVQMSGLQPPAPIPGPTRAAANGKGAANGAPMNFHPRLANKPPSDEPPLAALRSGRRAAILSIIQKGDDPGALVEQITSHTVVPDYDAAIDDQGHTALHLAASFARQNCCEALIRSGADMHRGNASGQTALMRAALAQHNYDKQSFSQLVTLLAPSIRTLDHQRKSVLHHIVHVAHITGRAPVARYYLNCILESIRDTGGPNPDFKSVVDLQDEDGETALNLACCIGNKAIADTLVDVGASKTLGNKLGVRPVDYGLVADEPSEPRAGDVINAIRNGPAPPLQKVDDIFKGKSSSFYGLKSDWGAELKEKQESFNKTNAHMKAQLRLLAERRQDIVTQKERVAALELVLARSRNLERALADDSEFEWIGRRDEDAPDGDDDDPPLPEDDSPEALIRLRRMRAWHARIESLVEQRIAALKGLGAEREYMYKKAIALCLKTPSLDDIDSMIDKLLLALDSDGSVDFVRISSFMRKVKEEGAM